MFVEHELPEEYHALIGDSQTVTELRFLVRLSDASHKGRVQSQALQNNL